jgi:DNA-binding response OmpR family regulator
MSKKVILVIDDDVDILDSIKVILEAHGFEAVTAATGKDGLHAFKTRKPDMVLCDMMMEHIDEGVHIAKEIRNISKKVPLFLLSSIGDATAGNIDLSNIGYTGVFQKPVDPDKMIDTIKRQIG